MKTLVLLFATLMFTLPAYSKNITLKTYNHCTLDTSVSAGSMARLKSCLGEKDAKRGNKNYPLYIYLNSPGGSVVAGLRFIDYAKHIKNLHTITSFSASMAAAIVQQLPGKRYVMDSGIFMFHRAKGRVSGQFGEGELEARLRLWKYIVAESEKKQAKRIGISHKEYKKRVKDEWWQYASESIRSNVADEIAQVKCSRELSKRKTTTTVRGFFGSSKVTRSACPVMN